MLIDPNGVNLLLKYVLLFVSRLHLLAPLLIDEKPRRRKLRRRLSTDQR